MDSLHSVSQSRAYQLMTSHNVDDADADGGKGGKGGKGDGGKGDGTGGAGAGAGGGRSGVQPGAVNVSNDGEGGGIDALGALSP